LRKGRAGIRAANFCISSGKTKGSLAELETQLLLAKELGFLRTEHSDELLARCDAVSRLVNGLMQSLRASKASAEKLETRD